MDWYYLVSTLLVLVSINKKILVILVRFPSLKFIFAVLELHLPTKDLISGLLNTTPTTS